MVGVCLRVGRVFEQCFRGKRAAGLYLFYLKNTLRQRTGLIHNDILCVCRRLQIVAALDQKADLGRTADAAKKAQRNGNDQRAWTGNNQKLQGSVDPFAKQRAAEARRAAVGAGVLQVDVLVCDVEIAAEDDRFNGVQLL